MMLSHWPCFTWKFFMIWFHKILKLIFQKPPSSPRNKCTEHWRKLPNFTAFLEIFLYLSKNNDFVEHVPKFLLIVLFIYLVDLVVLDFYFYLVPPFNFLKWNRYFSAWENLENSSCNFWKHDSVFLQILHHPSVSWNITPLYFLSSNIRYFPRKEPIKVQIFETFECSGQNLSNSSCKFWNNKSIPLQILHHSSASWNITPLWIFTSYIFYFGYKDPIKVPILRLSRALVKISQTL